MTEVLLHDFRKPGRLASSLEQGLRRWLRGTCKLTAERLNRQLPSAVEVADLAVEGLRPLTALSALPDGVQGYRLSLGLEGCEGLVVFSRPLLLALVAGMIGDSLTDLPADRELTVVEESLAEYLINGVLVPAVQETWPGQDALALRLLQREPNPKFSRVFPPEQGVVRWTAKISGSFGAQEWYVLLPQKPLQEGITQATAAQAEPEAASEARPRIEGIVRVLPVDLAVTLGRVELSLSQLARLRKGDIVILDQRVTEPLPAAVAGEPKFRVWPGRVGSHQAVQIESTLEG